MSINYKFSSLPLSEKREYFELIRYLFNSGSSIKELIAEVERAAFSNQAKRIFHRAKDLFEQGNDLSFCLYEANIIDLQEQAILIGAEKAGDFDRAFGLIIDNLKWNEDIHFKLDKALRFSSILLILIVLVCAVITNILLPKLLFFAQSEGLMMPLVTNSFLIFAVFIKKYGLYVVGGIFLLWIIGISLYQVSRPFRFIHDFVLTKLPIIGSAVYLSNQVRFLRILGSLLEQSVEHDEAVNLATNAMNNSFYKAQLRKAASGFNEGFSLSEVIQQAKFLPDIVSYQLTIAEERGQIAQICLQAAKEVDQKLQKIIDKGSSQAEPALAGIIMLIIFWVVIAVIAPIYDAVLMLN